MANYLITYPNGSQITAQGSSIKTVTAYSQIPPALPTTFLLWQGLGASGNRQWSTIYSYIVPIIYDQGGGFYSGGYYWWYPGIIFNQGGGNQTWNVTTNGTNWYVTPGSTQVPRCDVQVTQTSGQILTITGRNNVACPTWISYDCLPTEIKCPSTTDPRGYCCISCDSLNSKIRALI